MRRKCPYLSTQLECFAGSFGTVKCLDHKFHRDCNFKTNADNKGKKEELIQINF